MDLDYLTIFKELNGWELITSPDLIQLSNPGTDRGVPEMAAGSPPEMALPRQPDEKASSLQDHRAAGGLSPRQALTPERANPMKIKYDPESDILILLVREDPPVDAVEEPGGVIVSYGEDREAVSVEFLNVSARKLIHPGEVSVTIQAESRHM